MKNRSGGALDRAFPWLSLMPAVVVFVVLSVYPMLNLLAMSVSTFRIEGGVERMMFDPMANWRQLTADPLLKPAIVNTLIFVVVSVTLVMIVGLWLALMAARVTRGKGLLRTLIILPILVPPVAIGSMWRLIYNYEFGVINQFLGLFGLDPVNWLGDGRFALISVIFVDVWHWAPFIFLILFAAVEGIPVDVIEAARIDGASQSQITRYVMLPMLLPAIVVAFTFRSILAFKAFDEVFLLTSGGPGTATEIVSLLLYKTFFVQNNMGYGALLSIAVILMVVSFLLVSRRASAAIERR